VKLDHYFAQELVIRAQDVANLYVSYVDCRGRETDNDNDEKMRQVAEDSLLSALQQAFGWFVLSYTAFVDRLVAACAVPPESGGLDHGEGSDDPPWDF